MWEDGEQTKMPTGPLMRIQNDIYGLVVQRGFHYMRSWPARQAVGRIFVKLLEEVGELSYLLLDPNECEFAGDMELVTEQARHAFRDYPEEYFGRIMGDTVRTDASKIMSEMADVAVVLFCMAATVGRLIGKSYSLIFWATRKAHGDLERDVSEDEPVEL